MRQTTIQRAMYLTAAALAMLVLPARAELVLYSSMDNADISGTTVLDLAGDAQNGTILGSVSIGAPGHNGEAISIDAGGASYVDYGDQETDGHDAFDPINGDLTVSIWFKTETLSSIQYILSKGNSASSGAEGYSMFIEPITGGVRLWTRVSSDNAGANTDKAGNYIDNAITTDTWYNLTLVIDNTADTLTGYLNGSNAGFATNLWGNTFSTSPIDTSNPLIIGGRPQNSNGFQGDLDELVIYDEALNASQVMDLYQNGVQTLHAGDANGDGMVNLADLQILGDNWQSTTAGWAEADFTGDGNVNLADLQILGDNWGFGVGPDLSLDEALALVSVPEPATAGLLGLGWLLALRSRTSR